MTDKQKARTISEYTALLRENLKLCAGYARIAQYPELARLLHRISIASPERLQDPETMIKPKTDNTPRGD